MVDLKKDDFVDLTEEEAGARAASAKASVAMLRGMSALLGSDGPHFLSGVLTYLAFLVEFDPASPSLWDVFRVAQNRAIESQKIREVLSGAVVPDASHVELLHLIPVATSNKLSGLPYDQFLRTPYWQLIRLAVFERDGHQCVLCSRRDLLHCHHNSYSYRGYENTALHTLATLCADCHARYHDKVPRPAELAEAASPDPTIGVLAMTTDEPSRSEAT